MEELPARRQALTDVQNDRANARNEEKRRFFRVALRTYFRRNFRVKD